MIDVCIVPSPCAGVIEKFAPSGASCSARSRSCPKAAGSAIAKGYPLRRRASVAGRPPDRAESGVLTADRSDGSVAETCCSRYGCHTPGMDGFAAARSIADPAALTVSRMRSPALQIGVRLKTATEQSGVVEAPAFEARKPKRLPFRRHTDSLKIMAAIRPDALAVHAIKPCRMAGRRISTRACMSMSRSALAL